MTAFTREVIVSGAFDKRNSDPSKNYGIHGMEIRFLLHGPSATMQFVVFTNMHLPHVHEELHARKREARMSAPTGADIGYHADAPRYDGQTAMACTHRPGGQCFYDGTSLGADEFMPEFLAGGSDAAWAMLEQRYAGYFDDETDDAA